MKYQLAVRELAEQDMQEAFDFYETEQEGLGRRFHDEVAMHLRRLEKKPELYPFSELKPVRKAALAVFPYCLYYRVSGKRIDVIAVHDARRDPKRWRRRVK